MYYRVKTLVRPITGHRKILERAKYLGTKILSPQEGNNFLARSMGRPAAIGKIGSGELGGLRHYLRRADSNGHCESWSYHAQHLYRIAGVYPPEPEIFSRFCRTYAESLTHLDVLAVWFNWKENAMHQRFAPKATLMALRALEPYYHDQPWSQQLADKRVLVVSPFAESIQAQYRRRQEVWRAKPSVLPEFELRTLRVPLSAYLNAAEYPDWFSTLDALRRQMAFMQFDVAIVGAGAWSIPLVAHAKSLGAWAIHLGGPTQILFGIKGNAWENHPQIAAFFNEAWIRPSASETPQGIQQIENGRYW
jgi:hypothetical protein